MIETIKEAKQYLDDNHDKGIGCPCCNQFVKMYKRKLGSAQSRALIIVYNNPSEWMHVSDINKQINIAGDFAKLQHWGLIVQKPNKNIMKKSSGLWKLTKKGNDFIVGGITIPSHIHILNNEVMGFSDTHTSIIESLGKHFDYKELMM